MTERVSGTTTLLLPSHYLPLRELFHPLKNATQVYVESESKWKKHSLFNRTWILGANGPISLSVPLEHNGKFNKPIRDLRISYQDAWIRVHKGALFSSYNTSAFFPYFRDDLFLILDKKYRYMHDLNLEIIQLLVHKLKLNLSFLSIPPEIEVIDLRPCFDLETIKASFSALPAYHQVFSYKFPFRPYLSILDILSNTGEV